jgi:hypothetical protein
MLITMAYHGRSNQEHVLILLEFGIKHTLCSERYDVSQVHEKSMATEIPGRLGMLEGDEVLGYICVLAVKPIHVVSATEAVMQYNRVDLHTKQQVWNKAVTVKYEGNGMFSK